jgi:[acyl-carrier-protein] S-malonyltransferase
MASAGGAKRAVMLPVSAPFHSELMIPAREKLEADLRNISFGPLRVPIVTNVDAEITSNGDEVRASLIRQLTLPVRWEESIRTLIDQGVNTFVEAGPGRVLTGLLRQIDRSVHVFNVEDEKSLHQTLDKLAQAREESAEA